MKRKVTQREPIALRTKELKGGKLSLYLDTYQQGGKNHAHRYEFLKLYLIPEKSKADKEQNKATLQAAKAIQAQRLIERAQGKANIKTSTGTKILLIDYMKHFAELKAKYGQSEARKKTINKVIKHIECYNACILLSDVDKNYCIGFIEYLANAKNRKNKKKPAELLSRYTATNYYQVLIAVLNSAVKDDLIQYNPANKVTAEQRKAITPQGTLRTYLDIDELKTLSDTKCGNENMRNAFLFACFTGLRISDIKTLMWENIHTENGQRYITKEMVKTRHSVTVPISANAAKYLPEEQKSGLVFALPQETTINNVLQTWAKRAGITKHISFHISRHTFATTLLTQGADLYTTSKLLGHTDIQTTQIYAEIVNAKKVEAVNLLDKINL